MPTGMPSYYNWNYSMPSLGPNGELVSGPDPYADQADPSKGTDIRWSDDSWQHFDPHQDREGNYISPTVFMSDSLEGGHAAAFPDTDEYGHIGRVFRTDRNRAIGKMLALIGGGALAANMLPAAGAGANAGEQFGTGFASASDAAFGSVAPEVAAGAGELAPITVGASVLPGGTAGGFLGGLGTTEMAAFPALAGAGAAGGGGALASIAPSGLPSGVGAYTPAGAGMASGEAASVTPATTGFFGKLGSLGKNAVMNPDGSYNWENIIKIGGTALGAIGAAHNSQNPGTPALPAGWNDHLSPTPLSRHVVGLGSDDAYRNYGQSGGEHQFFQPGPATSAAARTNVRLNDPTDFTQEPVMRSGGHYIKGPGTGRSDEIDAKLSNDEYVMDAETVALLGDGSPEAGAKKLDQLRANIRKHKGQQLAKGKFSANAKDPGEYIPAMRKARGGAVRFAKGGMLRVVPKPPVADDIRAAQLAAVQRMRDAIAKAQPQQPTLPPPAPMQKAEGGAVKAMNQFAEDLQREVLNRNPQRVAQLKSQMDSIMPGAGQYFEEGFAKGGKVKGLVESFGKFFNPPIGTTLPPKQALSPEDMAWMVQWLRMHTPESDALKHFDNTATPDLRGRVPGTPLSAPPEDIMKILGQE